MSSPKDYTVGWICAISTEYVAAQAFLDEKHERPDHVSTNDNNDYTLGKVGRHNVVIAVLPDGEYGTASAAIVARDMLHSFPNIRFGLMVGIGGGAPSPRHDIRLGDIVVSAPRDGKGGVFQYDFGKTIQDQSFQTTGFLNQPPVILRTAVNGLKAQYESEGHQLEVAIDNILEKKSRLRKKYKRPDPSNDRLYQSQITHLANDATSYAIVCGNNPSKLVLRPERSEDDDNPEIHYGLIASANQLMKDATVRDRLATEIDVLCFEMEAAGLINNFPCLVIRGICDYSDSHKNKEWQGYAAMAAAAYAKDLLCRIAPNRVEAEKRIGEILGSLLPTVSRTNANVKTIKDKFDKDEDSKILDWLTSIDYATQQSYFIAQRQTGTGQWVLESTKFQMWLSSNKQTLFCPGIPGAGKTFITSVVVDYIQTSYKSASIAYLYCNIGRQGEQTLEGLLGSILKQLVWNRSPLPKEVKDLYNQHKDKRSRPNHIEISMVLQSVISPDSRTFIIIDALDECQNHDSRRDVLLSETFTLQAKTRLNVFATSRPQEVEAKFSGSIVQEIIARDSDIEAYLDDKISIWEKLHESDLNNIRNVIKKEVTSAADGMFLLAALNINALQSYETEGDVRDALGNLAKGKNKLDQAYEQTMKRVQSQGESPKQLAIQSLAWIFHAKRPLSTKELLHALAVRPNKSKLDKSYCPSVKRLLSVCAGLVRLDEESKMIDLVHKTTRDYFELTKGTWFPNAESDITITSVAYLSLDVFQSGFCETDSEFEERLQSNPLYNYVAHNWGHHAREASTSCQGVIEFLQKQGQVEASSQALMAVKQWSGHKGYSQAVPKQMTSLNLAAYFGVEIVVRLLLEKGADVNAAAKDGSAPLYWASQNGHVDIVQLLLEKGTDVNAADSDGSTPLFSASANGHVDIARLLLEKGADVNAAAKDGSTPLHWASANGHIEVVQLLLAKGADVEAKDNVCRTPLLHAAKNGNEATINLLLATNRVDVDSVDYYNSTPLSIAARMGHRDVLALLLTQSQSLNIKDNFGQSPLWWAKKTGRSSIADLLFEKYKENCHKPKAKGLRTIWMGLTRRF